MEPLPINATDTDPIRPAGPRWVVCVCAEVSAAFPLLQVREVVPPLPSTRLPGCGPAVCGLAGLRGRVVTVFDLGLLLGLTASTAYPDHRLVIGEIDGSLVGLAVDRVLLVAQGIARPAPATVPHGFGASETLGLLGTEQGEFLALDLHNLMQRLVA